MRWMSGTEITDDFLLYSKYGNYEKCDIWLPRQKFLWKTDINYLYISIEISGLDTDWTL